MSYKEKIARLLLYGGLSREEYQRVKAPVAENNLKSLTHWSVLVSVFWLYCLAMSLRAADYALCRPAYTAALSACIVTYMCARFLVPRFPKSLKLFTCFFRLSLLFGGIGIAVLQWDVRSLTMFAVAIILPSIFIDNTVTSLIVDVIAVIGYILMGRGTIVPDVYSWGLGNFILFSVFGLMIGNAINRQRFERYVFAESAKALADMQTKYAYYDQMTGLKNRRAFSEELLRLTKTPPPVCCIVMVDINGLKEMNDTRGHDAGDELIIAASACLRAAFPALEDVYRLGGDEFCVIAAADEETVQSSIAALEQTAADWKGSFVEGVSLAVGMASGRNAADMEAIAKEADARMYEAKRAYYVAQNRDRRKR